MLYRQKNDLHERLFELHVTPHRIVVQSVESRLVLAHSGYIKWMYVQNCLASRRGRFGIWPRQWLVHAEPICPTVGFSPTGSYNAKEV